jgi:hypothetical protein
VATRYSTPLAPDTTLLTKLGSILVHAEELVSPYGHEVDRRSLVALLNDADVLHWREQMNALALLPVKRRRS